MYFQIRKDALWLVVRDKHLPSSCGDCCKFDKFLVSYIKEKMISKVSLLSQIQRVWKKQLRIFIGLLFCMQAYADAYYCTQTAKVLIEPNNKVKNIINLTTFINLRFTKENTLIFASLEDLNATKDLSEFTISLVSQSDEQIFARFQTNELLTDMKINFYQSASVDSKLVRTMSVKRIRSWVLSMYQKRSINLKE